MSDPTINTRNWLTLDGAHALARRIRAYWAERGYIVNTEIEKLTGCGSKDLYAIRSDLVNGAPQQKARVVQQ